MTDAGNPAGPPPLDAGGAAPAPFPYPAPVPGMTIGQILDRVVRLLRSHFRMYLGLALVPAAAALGALVVLGGLAVLSILPHLHNGAKPPNLWFLLWLAPPAVFLWFVVFVVYALYAAAVSHAVVLTNRGEAVTGAEAWAVAWKRGERYVWLMFLLALIVAGPIYLILGGIGGLFAILAVSAAHSNPAAPILLFTMGPIFMLLNLAAQVYMVLMFLRFGLSIPACMMEDLPAVEALKRSVALTRGAKGRIFVVLLVIYAASFAVIVVCELALLFVGGIGVFVATLMSASLHSPAFLFFFLPFGLVVALVVIVAVISLPYVGYSTALGVLYCDQKFRLDAATDAALPAAGSSV